VCLSRLPCAHRRPGSFAPPLWTLCVLVPHHSNHICCKRAVRGCAASARVEYVSRRLVAYAVASSWPSSTAFDRVRGTSSTAIAPAQQGAHVSYTPASAVNLSVPHSPFVAASPSTYAPSPAMRNTSVPYNPQQWGRSNGPMGGQYAPHTAVQTAVRTHDMTGMEGNLRPFLNFQMLCSVSRYSGSQSTLSLSQHLLVLLWGITKQS
jgi:hypothetical protein